MATAITAKQITAYLNTVKAVADAIKEVGEVPSGSLYAMLIEHLTLEQYNRIIGHLKTAGVVVEKNNVLYWQEPDLPPVVEGK